MRLRSKRHLLVFACGLWGLRAALAGESDERVLWNLWKQHKADAENHAAIIAASRQAEKDLASSPLLAPARGLLAWHLLRAGDTNGADAVLTATLSGTPSDTDRAAAEAARHWLTRLDAEKVRSALHAFYRRNVQFPETLDALEKLAAARRPPMKDRWDHPWAYRLVALQHVKGLKGQRYALESQTLGDATDLNVFLQKPYPDNPGLRAAKMMADAGGRKTILFETVEAKPQEVILAEGTGRKNLVLAFVGERIVVLADGDYWYVQAKPAL